MESYLLSHMPTELSQIHLSLFTNVKNAADIRSSLIAAATMEGPSGDSQREKYDFCFIEAKSVSLWFPSSSLSVKLIVDLLR